MAICADRLAAETGNRMMLTMAKATKQRASVELPTDEKVKLRRKAGAVEFYDEKSGKWIAVPTVPGLLDRLRDEGKIGEEDFQAGVRFAVRFHVAGLGVHYGAIAYDAIRVDGGGVWQEPLGGSEQARREVAAALDHVGAFGAECLRWLIGMGESIDKFVWRCRGNGRPIHERAVQHVLSMALGALTSFYRAERRHGEGR